jgi:amino acid adenylation domain-containing protein
MKPLPKFLSELYSRDIKLWDDDGYLGFDAPQGALSPELLDELRSRKQEILSFLQQTQKYAIPPAIQPCDRNQQLLLSFAQQRLWFLTQLEGASATYNMQLVLQLSGSLNVIALTWSLDEIVQRHEVLRTTFDAIDGQPYQVIHNDIKFELPIVNLQHLGEDVKQSEVKRATQEDAQRPFDLERDLMLRGMLLQLQPDEFVLVLSMHHIASDGWSLRVLLEEMVKLYEIFSRDGKSASSPLPPLDIQYADFAQWQRKWLQGKVLAQQLKALRSSLIDAPPLLQLPTDYPRPARQTFNGATFNSYLSPELSKALNLLSHKHGSTLFVTMLAAFMVLLSRYSDQENIVVGSHIANRNRKQIEPLVGFFVNTLALRADLCENPTFLSVLNQVTQVVQAAYDHQDVPYEMLVEELVPERNLSYSPLCQVTFVMQNVPQSGALQLPGLTVDWQDRGEVMARFDLTLFVFEEEERLICTWRYNVDLFRSDTIEAMAANFQTLLDAIVTHPAGQIRTLPLLSKSEQQKIFRLAQSTMNRSARKSFTELFEDRVQQTPDKLALIGQNLQETQLQYLSYQDLNHKVNQLAHHLQTLGVKADVSVGVYLPRSIAAVIAALAVFKIAGTYVPLDSGYPKQRIQYMMEEAQVSILLSKQELIQYLPEDGETIIIALDRDEAVIASQSGENLRIQDPVDSIAYIMFTSGSTGQPKGVLATYGNVCNYVHALPPALGIRSSDIYLHAASFSFGSSIRQFGIPLCQGATVVIATYREMMEPLALFQTIKSHAVTVIDLVPSHWSSCIDILELLESSERANLLDHKVRLVLAASDTLTFDLPYRWRFELNHPADVINMYGQTETTGIITIYPITDLYLIPENRTKAVPLGYPIANTQVYVLDKHLQPLPPGVPGDLYISGESLSAGYLNRPDLNKERFFPNPITANPEQCLYSAGDRVRYLPDGNLEFLGRHDYQVKLRGYRIELGEIEAALLTHPAVQKAVVVTQGESLERKNLVAYVVLTTDENNLPLTTSLSLELRNYLRERLPQYMIPGEFVPLTTIPTNVNRKVDRLALPQPVATVVAPGFVPPRDSLEQQLTEIWRDILGLCPASVQEGFFDVGGHSLLAVRLMTQIQKQLARQVPLAAIFEHQTIEALAAWLRQQPHSEPQKSQLLVPIQPQGTKPPFFCIPGVGGTTSYLYHLSRHLGPNQPFYGLQGAGLDGITSPHETIEAAATDYITAIQEVQPHGPYYLGGHSFGGKVAFEMAQQLQRQDEQIALLAIFDSIPYKLPDRDEGEFAENEIDNSTEKEVSNLILYLDAIAECMGKPSNTTYEQLAVLNPGERLLRIKQELEQLNFLPLSSNVNEVRGLIEVVLTSFHASKIYRPTKIENTSVTLFSPESHCSTVRERQVERWSEIGKVTLHIVPGTHASMLAEPNVSVLSEHLANVLTKLN